MIRKATFLDITDIIKLVYSFYEESLKEYNMSFDEVTLRGTTYNLIKNGVSLVNEEHGRITGVIMGVISPSIFDKNELLAQEIIWYVDKESRKSRAGLALIKEYVGICKELGASKIIMVYMNNLNGEVMDNLYRRKNYKPMEMQYIKEA